MKAIFLDTNILLDVTLRRLSFYPAAASIWADCEHGLVTGFVSAISLNNMYFIMSRFSGKTQALEAVRIVLNLFRIISLDEKILRLAAELPGRDFEDAIQLFSAVQSKAHCLVTRDACHFPNGYLPVLSPAEYLGLNDSTP